MRKEVKFIVLLNSILTNLDSIQVIQDFTTVLIKTIQPRNETFERIAINQHFKNMTYEEIIKAVEDGAKFTINFQKRTCRVNGKVVLSEEDKPLPGHYDTQEIIMMVIEKRYHDYKHSVPSERSESHRRYYFKALPEKSLTDEDMMYGERREVARCKLELFVLYHLLIGDLRWNPSWGTWFWQSDTDKDLVILRDWIEPNKGGA